MWMRAGGRENALQMRRLVVSRSHALHKVSCRRPSSGLLPPPTHLRPWYASLHADLQRSLAHTCRGDVLRPPSFLHQRRRVHPPLLSPRCASPPRPSSGPRGASARVHPHPASPLPYPHPPAPDHFRSSPQPIPFPGAKLRCRLRSGPHLALPRSRACASVYCAVDRLRAG
ncbi:hypothetical protein B0H13DRAFT_2083777 [Mycena leptocephala]|nr:hypothetical protein B0H13DRAFT_2083777 [Mycena leptocephala]